MTMIRHDDDAADDSSGFILRSECLHRFCDSCFKIYNKSGRVNNECVACDKELDESVSDINSCSSCRRPRRLGLYHVVLRTSFSFISDSSETFY